MLLCGFSFLEPYGLLLWSISLYYAYLRFIEINEMYTCSRFAVNGDLGDSVKNRGANTRSRQADYGMSAGDQSGHDCGVHPRTAATLALTSRKELPLPGYMTV